MHASLRYALLVALILLLTACQLEGGVARPTVPGAANGAPTTTPGAEMALTGAAPDASALPATPADGSLRLGLTSEPSDLLPYHNDSADERITAPISQLLFPAPLLALNYTYTTTGILERVPSIENGDVQIKTLDVFLDSAGLITTTETSVITQVQQLSVTYHWNPKLTWSDGTLVTADDSLFAYDLARKVNLGQEANSRLALLERYEKVDAHTTRAILRPDFTDAAYITTYWTPLPKHLLEGADLSTFTSSQYALVPVGYGPYMLERRDQGSMRLVRNPYWEAPNAPTALSLIFRDSVDLLRGAVTGGSLDVAEFELPEPTLAQSIQNDVTSGMLNLATTPSPIWEHLDFNLDIPMLQDIRLRRAIAQAINRQAMVDTLLLGHSSVLESWVVPGQAAAAPLDQLTRYPYNPDESRRLLDEIGYTDTDGDGLREFNGEPLTINLVTTVASPLRQAIATQIYADLAAVGVRLEIDTISAADLYRQDGPLYRRNFELALFAWIAGPDPRGWERWSCAGVPNEANQWTGNNFSGWCFFEADKAIRTATTTIDPTERQAAYLRQQQLFTQELPVLPLFQRVDVVVSAPSIRGPQPDSTAPWTWNLTSWGREP